MIVCDWCHGTKGGIDKVEIKMNNIIQTFDLCVPCLTAFFAAVTTEKRKRKELRPDSFLNKEV
jgi:hypothetical protein